jgi:hypothetical protein
MPVESHKHDSNSFNCADCHGEKGAGTETGPALFDGLKNAGEVDDFVAYLESLK